MSKFKWKVGFSDPLSAWKHRYWLETSVHQITSTQIHCIMWSIQFTLSEIEVMSDLTHTTLDTGNDDIRFNVYPSEEWQSTQVALV